MLSFFPGSVLDEILNLIESVSEGFPSYSVKTSVFISLTHSYQETHKKIIGEQCRLRLDAT